MGRAVWLAAFLLAVACAGVGAEEPTNNESSLVTMPGATIFPSFNFSGISSQLHFYCVKAQSTASFLLRVEHSIFVCNCFEADY
jgi:hypothetical protein